MNKTHEEEAFFVLTNMFATKYPTYLDDVKVVKPGYPAPRKIRVYKPDPNRPTGERNKPCPCGSDLKFKKCCFKNQ